MAQVRATHRAVLEGAAEIGAGTAVCVWIELCVHTPTGTDIRTTAVQVRIKVKPKLPMSGNPATLLQLKAERLPTDRPERLTKPLSQTMRLRVVQQETTGVLQEMLRPERLK